MIKGIGVDVIEIDRIAKAAKREAFIRKLLSADELAYWERHNRPMESLAGAFAAKEAVTKAMGTGFVGINLTDIEILHDAQGAPFARLHNAAAQRLQEMRGARIMVSISHCKSCAVATAILEAENE